MRGTVLVMRAVRLNRRGGSQTRPSLRFRPTQGAASRTRRPMPFRRGGTPGRPFPYRQQTSPRAAAQGLVSSLL